jgi:hypothetical protein
VSEAAAGRDRPAGSARAALIAGFRLVGRPSRSLGIIDRARNTRRCQTSMVSATAPIVAEGHDVLRWRESSTEAVADRMSYLNQCIRTRGGGDAISRQSVEVVVIVGISMDSRGHQQQSSQRGEGSRIPTAQAGLVRAWAGAALSVVVTAAAGAASARVAIPVAKALVTFISIALSLGASYGA